MESLITNKKSYLRIIEGLKLSDEPVKGLIVGVQKS